jgi:hypothetical protein
MVRKTITDRVCQGGKEQEIPQGSCGVNRAQVRFAEHRNGRSRSKPSRNGSRCKLLKLKKDVAPRALRIANL